jgi:hypothetical protein
MAVELALHQIMAYRSLSSGKILEGGVGTGKTRTALAYYFIVECQGGLKVNGVGTWKDMKTPKDIYVITTAKKRDELDWEEEAVAFGVFRDPEHSRNGVKIVVDSWNNIMNYVDVKNAFFIFDEQRLVGSGAWTKAFYKIAKANTWILLSATPGDSWIEYVPLFVANGFYRNRTDFVEQHVIWKPYTKFPQIKGYIGQQKLERQKAMLRVHMPYAKHTKRHTRYISVKHDKAKYKKAWEDRWNVYEERPIKDAGELFRVVRKIVNSDPDRPAAIMQLMEKHPRLIVFYNFDYELEALRVVADVLGVEKAEWNGHKHQEVPTGEKWLYLVQYTAGAEGWNCVATDATAFFSLNYSYKIKEQAMGRIDRLNTEYTDLMYYFLRSDSTIDAAILKALAMKKNFNEKELMVA